MDALIFHHDQKTLANYSLPDHLIKFYRAMWQLTYKKNLTHSNLFFIKIIIIRRKKNTQIINDIPKYFADIIQPLKTQEKLDDS